MITRVQQKQMARKPYTAGVKRAKVPAEGSL
jgi:hypothetical protein